MANMIRGRVPWHRDTREGVFTKSANFVASSASSSVRPGTRKPPVVPASDLAPWEITVTADLNSVLPATSGRQCLGAGGEAAFRVSDDWQLVAELSGCKQRGMAPNMSGDSLTVAGGPRWTPRTRSHWRPYAELLLGVNKLNQEIISPERKQALTAASKKAGEPPPDIGAYTHELDRAGFALMAGTGMNLRLNRAAALRVASLEYVRSWAGELSGQRYGSGLQFRTGVTLQLGTW